jgi:hypothetical protein
MSPKRSVRTLMAGALSLSLLAALMAMPAVVMAGVPNWVILPDNDTDANSVTELPAKVEPGENAGYSVTIRNNGPSTISQLFAFTGEGTPVAEFAAASQGACSPADEAFFCSLGALPAGATVTIVGAFATPTEGTSFSVDFFFNTTGLGTGDGDSSHGDELQATGTTVLSQDPNFAGGFSTELAETESNGAISGTNLVSTSLTAPDGQKNLILTVADETALSDNPACTGCIYPAFTAELHLGDGSASFGLMTVVIDYQKNLWKTANFNKLSVVHIHDDLTRHEIPFSSSCSGEVECATFTNLPGGHGQVTLYLAQNGWVKYH